MPVKKISMELELPEDVLELFESCDAIEAEVREAFIIDLLRQGKLSQGRVAEILSVDRWDLPPLMAKHGLTAFAVTPEELGEDQQDLAHYLSV